MNAVLMGNLTIDENEIEKRKYTSPGGAVFYMAKTFENFSLSPTIISPYGDDFPKKYLPKTRFIPEKPLYQKTLVFKNKYHAGLREQWVKNYKEYLVFDPPIYNGKDGQTSHFNFKDKDIVIIAPVINNISLDQIDKIKKFYPLSIYCLFPQGFYRKIYDGGRIKKALWKAQERIISCFDFICFSQEDLDDGQSIAKNWSYLGPLVVITRAQHGSSLYQMGKKLNTSSYHVDNIIDSTGAGDVFGASFAFSYAKSSNVDKSLQFANASAAYSLRVRADKLQYSYRDVLKFAASQKRSINICPVEKFRK